MFRLYNGDYGGNEEFVKIQVLNIGFKLAVLYAKHLFAYLLWFRKNTFKNESNSCWFFFVPNQHKEIKDCHV